MSQRTVEVDVSLTLVLRFDDEALSDWDGRTLLTRHENPEAYRPGTTPGEVLAHAAYVVGMLGSRDGFADFPREALSADFRDPEFDATYLDGERIR